MTETVFDETESFIQSELNKYKWKEGETISDLEEKRLKIQTEIYPLIENLGARSDLADKEIELISDTITAMKLAQSGFDEPEEEFTEFEQGFTEEDLFLDEEIDPYIGSEPIEVDKFEDPEPIFRTKEEEKVYIREQRNQYFERQRLKRLITK